MTTKAQTVRVLVRKSYDPGLVAHLPNTWGRPLCKMRLKLEHWDLVEVELAYAPGAI
jgi:hypothetical protein